jgi:hypothetical protein|tara:strand:+ start:40 stop:285 length:246 start_codon:yes stop_codon:yes gene_type:complete
MKITKSKLKEMIREELVEASDKIQVKGVGTYDYDTLKKKVQKMSLDLVKNAKKGNWKRLSVHGIRAFAEMWQALSEYEEKK